IYATGLFDRLNSAIGQMLALYPHRADCLARAAVLLSRIPGESERARALSANALESRREDPSCWFCRGEVMNSLGYRELAIESLEAAIRPMPEDAIGFDSISGILLLAECYTDYGDGRQSGRWCQIARGKAQELLSLDPALGSFLLARSLSLMSDRPGAIEAY